VSYRILVADELSAEGLDILREAGQVDVVTGMDQAALAKTLPGYHALIVRSATKVHAQGLEGANRLVVVGRAGIGVDNIDVEAATARGIAVMNTPEANAVTTGEHALSLMLSMARNIPAADASLRSGKWDKSRFTGVELTGKTLGVLGLGRIGRVVAERALGLQMDVVAYDPHLSQAHAPAGVRLVELDELLGAADFVSVHVPLMDETMGLLNAERIAKMKPGARLVHAARGGIVVEEALCDALDSGHLAGAALDVFEKEPLDPEHRLFRTPNLVLTPHLGASTTEAKRLVSRDIALQTVLCLRRGIVLNGVNVPRVSPGEAHQVAPFMALVHSLASFLAQVFDGEVQSLRLSVQGALPENARAPLTAQMIAGALNHREDRPVTAVNASSVAEARGVRVHSEAVSLKRDFMNLVRVEAVIGGTRHIASGTVLGQRHGRMVELDDYLLDAIPEGPILVTFHADQPGVLGALCSTLGERGINIDRMQLGPTAENGQALGILNLSAALDDDAIAAIRGIPAIRDARRVV